MSGRITALKVAARDAKRNKKRTLFLVALVAAPVLVAVVVAGLIRANTVTVEERVLAGYGTADVAVWTYNSTEEIQDWIAAIAKSVDPDAETLHVRTTLWSGGVGRYGQLLDLDLTHPIGEGFRRLIVGRGPVTADEIVLTEYLAEAFGVGVGDTVEFPLFTVYGDDEREMTVVGLMSHPVFWQNSDAVVVPEILDEIEARNLPSGGYAEGFLLMTTSRETAVVVAIREAWDEERFQFFPQGREWPVPDEMAFISEDYWAILSDGQLDELAILVNTEGVLAAQSRLMDMVSHDEFRQFQLPSINPMGRQERLRLEGDRVLESAPVVGTAVAAVLLVEVAFLAGAAFATGTRRRLRDLGLMSSNGASDRHVRTTVVGEGLVVGLLAALAGAAVGAVALIFLRPALQPFVERRISEFPLTVLDLAGPMLLAVVACVVAAWYPAKTASEVPTLTALQGRMPVSTPKRWVPVAGVIATLFGTLIYGAGLTVGGGRRGTAVTLMGVVLMIGGVAMLAGPIVSWVSRRASKFSISPRIVLRDSGRHRTRAAGAIAATMVIAVLPVALLSSAYAENQRQTMLFGLAPSNPQAIIRGQFDAEGGESRLFTIDDLNEVRSLVDRAVAALPGGSGAVIRAIDRDVEYPAVWAFTREGEIPPYTHVGFGDGQIGIADEELLAFLDEARLGKALEADGMVLIGIQERRTEIGIDGEAVTIAEVPVGVQGTYFPRVLVTEEVAARFGWSLTYARGVVSTEPGWGVNPSRSHWRPVYDLNLGLMLEGDSSILAETRTLALAAVALTLLVVLVVVASITALSAAEADGDLQVMVAVGAKNSIRRKYLGLQALFNTLFGALLATPLALLLVGTALSVGFSMVHLGNFGTFNEGGLYVPWIWITMLVVGLPVAVGLLTALFVRSAPFTPPRRAF